MKENADYLREEMQEHFPLNFMIWIAKYIIPIVIGVIIIDKVHYNKICYPNKLRMFICHPYLSLRNNFRECKLI